MNQLHQKLSPAKEDHNSSEINSHRKPGDKSSVSQITEPRYRHEDIVSRNRWREVEVREKVEKQRAEVEAAEVKRAIASAEYDNSTGYCRHGDSD